MNEQFYNTHMLDCWESENKKGAKIGILHSKVYNCMCKTILWARSNSLGGWRVISDEKLPLRCFLLLLTATGGFCGGQFGNRTRAYCIIQQFYAQLGGPGY